MNQQAKERDMPQTRKTTTEKKRIVKDIFLNFDDVPRGCDKHGISVASYYAWKNKFYNNGKALTKAIKNKAKSERKIYGADEVLGGSWATTSQVNELSTKTNVNPTLDVESLVQENNFLWKKVTRLISTELL